MFFFFNAFCRNPGVFRSAVVCVLCQTSLHPGLARKPAGLCSFIKLMGETIIIKHYKCICSCFIIITKQTAVCILVASAVGSHLKPAPPPVARLPWSLLQTTVIFRTTWSSAPSFRWPPLKMQHNQ